MSTTMLRIVLDRAPDWRTACAAIVVALGIGLAVSVQTLSAGLLARLEHRFARPEIGNGEQIIGVVALGGNADRVREAGRLARLHPHMAVVVSGAGSRADVLPLLGPDIRGDRILVDPISRNTHENALCTSRIVRSRAAGQWLLITSASHMPRAVGAFRKNGVNVLAWPIFDLQPGRSLEKIARHETLGLVAYWVLGKSSALFPS